MYLHLKKFLLRLLPVLALFNVAAADWTTQLWDVIIVGAGPAGIIGQS